MSAPRLSTSGAALLAALTWVSAVRAGPPEVFPVPSPSLVAQLRSQHQRQDWLRVTMTSTHLELRARQIDEEGLSGLTARGHDRRRLEAYLSDPSSRGHLPWSSISRIDRLRSQSRIGQIGGAIPGVIMGGNLPNPYLGVLSLGLVGAWLGGRIGDQFVSVHPFYQALPLPPPSAPAASNAHGAAPPADSVLATRTDAVPSVPRESALPSTTTTSPGSAPEADASPVANSSREVLMACRRISPEDLLRIESEFGQFQGYALRIGIDGLDGLREDRGARSFLPPPPDMLAWDRIDRIHKRGGSAGRGALAGAVTLGCLGGMISAAAVSIANGDEKPSTAFVEGAAVSGAVGAALGGLIGSAIPGWHLVYKRPIRRTDASRP